MRWRYVKYDGIDGFQIDSFWTPPPGRQDAKLAECNAAWQARSHEGRPIRIMFVIDDAKPIGEILLRGGIVDGSVWAIWNSTGEERVRLSMGNKPVAAPTIMGSTVGA